MNSPRGACVAELTWPEVEQRLHAGQIPVLTVGAGSKAHGAHLPLDTDLRQATWLGQAIASRWSAIVWPAISYGTYPAFVQYPGSVTLDAAVFAATVDGIVASIRAHTSAPLLLVNTGISTISAIDAVAHERGFAAVHVYRGTHLARAREQFCSQNHGGHGDEAETAVMRFIAPDTVDMRKAQAHDHPMAAGVLSRTPGDTTYTPFGVWGRPDLATAATGRAMTTAMLRDIETAWDGLRADV